MRIDDTRPICIQLTGSVDVAVESLNKHASSSGKSDLQINDGIWGGSKVGIVGSEELGNGLKAIFNLEYRARADTGRLANANRFWQGKSWVGLDGGFGTIKLGRQDTPMSDVISLGDMTGQSWYYSSDALAGYTSKRDNTISHVTPSPGGFTAALLRRGAEHVHRARHVGVVLQVVLGDRVDDHPGFLGGVGRIQVDQRMFPHRTAQDGKIPSNRFDVKDHFDPLFPRLPLSARMAQGLAVAALT